MAKPKTLRDLFLDTLKDIYFAEKKILSALPKMAKAAQTRTEGGLREAPGRDRGPGRAARAGVRVDRREPARQDLRCDHGHPRGRQGDHGRVQGRRRPSTPACLRPRRPSSTTRFPATARSRPGRANSVCKDAVQAARCHAEGRGEDRRGALEARAKRRQPTCPGSGGGVTCGREIAIACNTNQRPRPILNALCGIAARGGGQLRLRGASRNAQA